MRVLFPSSDTNGDDTGGAEEEQAGGSSDDHAGDSVTPVGAVHRDGDGGHRVLPDAVRLAGVEMFVGMALVHVAEVMSFVVTILAIWMLVTAVLAISWPQ
jgi:hypothetical protein